jgi:hypothetical protein
VASEIGKAYNTAPSMANLLRLASDSPAEAREVIGSLKRSVDGAGSNAPASVREQLDSVADVGDADLSEAIANSPLFQAIFPSTEAQNFSDVIAQVQNPSSIGWEAAEVGQGSFTGVARKNEEGRYVIDVGGREFGLTSSYRLNSVTPGMQAAWLNGFLQDGPDQMLTIQGTIGNDGKDILVEGFMPGSSDEFVFGRVQVYLPDGVKIEPFGSPPDAAIVAGIVANGRVTVQTSRGEIEVTNPELKTELAHLPRLGVILPVPVNTETDGRRTISASVQDYFSLGGRFQANPQMPATDLGNGVYASEGKAAYDNFSGTFEISGGPGVKHRLENNGGQRNFPLGHFEDTDGDGRLDKMKGPYVSIDLGEYQLNTNNVTEGNALQQLSGSAEVAIRRVQGDYVRQVPPPPAP